MFFVLLVWGFLFFLGCWCTSQNILYTLIILWENTLGELVIFSSQYTFIKHTKSLSYFKTWGFFPFQYYLEIILTRFFPLESWTQNMNYISRPITQGTFLKSVLGIQLLFAHTLIKCKAFKSNCFKLNGWVSAKQIDLIHRAWSIANYNSITMKGLNSINKIQIFKVTWAEI